MRRRDEDGYIGKEDVCEAVEALMRESVRISRYRRNSATPKIVSMMNLGVRIRNYKVYFNG